jgi:hypothetical protein
MEGSMNAANATAKCKAPIAQEWDLLWGAFIAARRSGDADRIDTARIAIEKFDREHCLPSLACMRHAGQ